MWTRKTDIESGCKTNKLLMMLTWPANGNASFVSWTTAPWSENWRKRLTAEEPNELRNYGKRFSTVKNFQESSKSAKLAVRKFNFEHLEESFGVRELGFDGLGTKWHTSIRTSSSIPGRSMPKVSQRTCQFSRHPLPIVQGGGESIVVRGLLQNPHKMMGWRSHIWSSHWLGSCCINS